MGQGVDVVVLVVELGSGVEVVEPGVEVVVGGGLEVVEEVDDVDVDEVVLQPSRQILMESGSAPPQTEPVSESLVSVILSSPSKS